MNTQHVAINARRAAALHENILGLDQGLGAVATVMRMGDTQYQRAHASGFVGHLR